MDRNSKRCLDSARHDKRCDANIAMQHVHVVIGPAYALVSIRVHSWLIQQKSHAREKRTAKPSLPSAALPASGSRGRPPIGTSQPSGSPALSREATATKIEVNRVKELLVIRCWLFVRRSRPTSLRQGYDLASTAASTPNIAELRVLRDLCGKR